MNGNKKLLTILEYAEIINFTKQGVYKQLNNPKSKLNQYLKIIDGKKYIDSKALEDTELTNYKQQLNNESKQVEQQLNNSLLELLEKQIEEKDKQIDNLNKQLEQKDKQIETLHNLLNQSQQLQAADKKLLLESQQKKRKGILYLFARKEKTENETN